MIKEITVVLDETLLADNSPLRTAVKMHLDPQFDCFVSEMGNMLLFTRNGSIVSRAKLDKSVIKIIENRKRGKITPATFKMLLPKVLVKEEREPTKAAFVFSIERSHVVRSHLYIEAEDLETAKKMFAMQGTDAGIEREFERLDDDDAELIEVITVNGDNDDGEGK